MVNITIEKYLATHGGSLFRTLKQTTENHLVRQLTPCNNLSALFPYELLGMEEEKAVLCIE